MSKILNRLASWPSTFRELASRLQLSCQATLGEAWRKHLGNGPQRRYYLLGDSNPCCRDENPVS